MSRKQILCTAVSNAACCAALFASATLQCSIILLHAAIFQVSKHVQEQVNARRFPNVWILHEAHENAFLHCNIVQYFIETLLLQLLSFLCNLMPAAITFSFFESLHQFGVLQEALFVHPAFHIIHPLIVQPSRFFSTERTIAVRVMNAAFIVQLYVVPLPDFNSFCNQPVQTHFRRSWPVTRVQYEFLCFQMCR